MYKEREDLSFDVVCLLLSHLHHTTPELGYPTQSLHKMTDNTYQCQLRLNIISPEKVEIIPSLNSLPSTWTTCEVAFVYTL